MHSDSVIVRDNVGIISWSHKKFYSIIKRIVDILCGLIGVIVMLPLAIIIKAVSVANKDFNSIFFKQERIGKDGHLFMMYKFRSMVPNADEVLEDLMKNDEKFREEYSVNKKAKNDPRITKIGRILRRTSLDEIPQFINVLKGDMSLIGNRPYLPREKKDMGRYYKDIILTKPGITGYWQTSGRENSKFVQRLKLESYYSKNHSLKMDIKIFFKTFGAIFHGHGAAE